MGCICVDAEVDADNPDGCPYCGYKSKYRIVGEKIWFCSRCGKKIGTVSQKERNQA